MFFFPKPKKKSGCVFFFPRKSSSAIHSDFDEVLFFFLTKVGCFFFAYFGCFFVFFFSRGQVHMSFIHSILEAGKKNTTRKKKQLFHSFNRNPSKMRKNELIREIKKNTVPLPKGPFTYYVILHTVFHVKRVTFFLVNRVEDQKLNQAAAELPLC